MEARRPGGPVPHRGLRGLVRAARPDPEGRRPMSPRKQRGEQLMVDRAEFTSYYGRPVIKAPSWSARDIAGYFFLGGLAGAGSVLA
ncbi:polysulfide reductase, partial [Streptomyces chartreusis]